MSELFLKALRWYLIAFCAVIGTTSFILAEQYHSIRPVGIGVLAFGFVYIMTAFWKDIRGKLLALNIGVFFALTLLSPYAYDALYVLFGWELRDLGFFSNKYAMWAGVEAVLGIPIMVGVFYFYD